MVHAVVHRDGFVEGFECEDVKDGGEGFFARDRELVGLGGTDDGGLDVDAIFAAFDGDARPADEDLAALGFGVGDGVIEAFATAGVDERADEGAVFERIADAGVDLLVGIDEARADIIGDAFVDDESAGGGAALACGAGSAEDDGGNGEGEVGVLIDDGGVVAA